MKNLSNKLHNLIEWATLTFAIAVMVLMSIYLNGCADYATPPGTAVEDIVDTDTPEDSGIDTVENDSDTDTRMVCEIAAERVNRTADDCERSQQDSHVCVLSMDALIACVGECSCEKLGYYQHCVGYVLAPYADGCNP